MLTWVKVDELWDSMCQSAIKLITSQLHTVDNDDLLLKIKGRIALFMLTMEVSSSLDLVYALLMMCLEMGLLCLRDERSTPHSLFQIF